MLANSGHIDPERIESYIAAEGYQALHDVLREMTPKEVVDTIHQERLRGRGGAGYPTGLKWATVAKTPSQQKYVICNADEGDPGAFMDRSVLESDPHSVLEGMAIAGYAVGASQGFIYVRAEYPLAISRLQIAIKQAKQLGLLGSGIFESPFNFNIDLRIGAGAFVCGEETALMASVEGKRGTPRPRPPFPAESGLWNCPTLINNVETFANVAPIIRKGADWFAGIGTEKSKGTKVFALAGKITNTGLIEVPMGTTAAEDRRGDGRRGAGRREDQGRADGRPFGRVHSGRGAGHAGGLRVADQAGLDHGLGRHDRDGRDHPDGGRGAVLHGILHGRIVRQMHSLPRGHRADAPPADQDPGAARRPTRDLQKLEELCDMVRNTSLCGLGQTAPNPVMSTLRFFRDGIHGAAAAGHLRAERARQRARATAAPARMHGTGSQRNRRRANM